MLYIGCLHRQHFLVATLYVGLRCQHFLVVMLNIGLCHQHFLMVTLYVGLRHQHFFVAALHNSLCRQHFLLATVLLNECKGHELCGMSFIRHLFLLRGCRLMALFFNRCLSLPVLLFSLIGECLGLCGGHLHVLLLRLQSMSKSFILVVLAGKSSLTLLLP